MAGIEGCGAGRAAGETSGCACDRARTGSAAGDRHEARLVEDCGRPRPGRGPCRTGRDTSAARVARPVAEAVAGGGRCRQGQASPNRQVDAADRPAVDRGRDRRDSALPRLVDVEARQCSELDLAGVRIVDGPVAVAIPQPALHEIRRPRVEAARRQRHLPVGLCGGVEVRSRDRAVRPDEVEDEGHVAALVVQERRERDRARGDRLGLVDRRVGTVARRGSRRGIARCAARERKRRHERESQTDSHGGQSSRDRASRSTSARACGLPAALDERRRARADLLGVARDPQAERGHRQLAEHGEQA